jgi:hypothetical protein
MPLHLHRPLLCFYHHLHFYGLLYFHLHFYGCLYFHLNNVLLPCVLLRFMCFHKMLFHNFIFLRFFNKHQIYLCSFWSYLFFCMLISFVSAQKFNCICSSFIYIANYHLNCIFSLYNFPSTHFEDDDECGGNLIANDWIFNMPFLSSLLSYSSTSIFLNNFASSSYLCLCSLLCASFSFVIFCNFLIALSTFMLLWTPKLWKHTQLPTTNANYFQWLPLFFILELLAHRIHFLTCMSSFN